MLLRYRYSVENEGLAIAALFMVFLKKNPFRPLRLRPYRRVAVASHMSC